MDGALQCCQHGAAHDKPETSDTFVTKKTSRRSVHNTKVIAIFNVCLDDVLFQVIFSWLSRSTDVNLSYLGFMIEKLKHSTFFYENLVDFNEARLQETTLNLYTHA